jgi:hypothetical protein
MRDLSRPTRHSDLPRTFRLAATAQACEGAPIDAD